MEGEVITGQQEWLGPHISTLPRPQKEEGPRGGIQLVQSWNEIPHWLATDRVITHFPFCRPRHAHTNRPLCLRRTSCRPRQDRHHRLSSCFLLPSLCACACARAHLSPSCAFSRGFELKLLFDSCYHCWILVVLIVRGLRGQRRRQRKILCVCVCVCREFVVVMN